MNNDYITMYTWSLKYTSLSVIFCFEQDDVERKLSQMILDKKFHGLSFYYKMLFKILNKKTTNNFSLTVKNGIDNHGTTELINVN